MKPQLSCIEEFMVYRDIKNGMGKAVHAVRLGRGLASGSAMAWDY